MLQIGRLVAAAVALLSSACAPTMQWLPHRAKYEALEPTTDRAVVVYEGDAVDFLRCKSDWMGDMVCDPHCDHDYRFGIEASAARLGATHIRKMESGSKRIGTDVSSSDVNWAPGVSTGSTEVRDKYATWEDYRLYWVGEREQRRCLDAELRAKPR